MTSGLNFLRIDISFQIFAICRSGCRSRGLLNAWKRTAGFSLDRCGRAIVSEIHKHTLVYSASAPASRMQYSPQS